MNLTSKSAISNCFKNTLYLSIFRRYARERYDTQTRKARNPTESWFNETLQPFLRKGRKSLDEEEEKQSDQTEERSENLNNSVQKADD